MKNLFVLIAFFIAGILMAQNTFEFVLEYPVRKSSRMAIEAENGDVIALVLERTGVDYSPSSPIRSYLLKFTPQGDTTTYHYTFGDTLVNLHFIERAYNGGYLLAGNASTPDSDEYLILVRIDDNLNKIWVKYHDMTGYWTVILRRVFHLNYKYLLALELASEWPLPLGYHQLAWFDTLGNMMSYYLHDVRTHGTSDYLLNKDSTRIWAFSPMYKDGNNKPARLVFDTTPQFISHSIRSYGDWYTTVLWHTDSTFLLSAEALRPDFAGGHDRDMWIISYDSMMNVIHSNYFGAYDTLDNTGIGHNIDFRHPDTVYFAGWKHQRIGKPPPGRVSWIMTGQTNAQLQPRYLHFIGGDYYYETYYILATKDGGCFICAARFNHATQVYDPVFLKLNNEGLLVGTNKERIPIKKTAFWPNPFSDGLHYHTLHTGSQFRIYDMAGREVFYSTIHSTSGYIQIGNLPLGSYIYELRYTTGAIETGKLIKTH